MPTPAYRDRKILGIPRDRHQLYDYEVQNIVISGINQANEKVIENKKYKLKEIEYTQRGKKQKVKYFINPEGDIIIPYPLGTVEKAGVSSITYDDVVTCIYRKELKIRTISGTLVGKGTGERHFVAFNYNPSNDSMQVFDSKFSRGQFFKSQESPTLGQKIIGALLRSFQILSYAVGINRTYSDKFDALENIGGTRHKVNVKVHRLNTQSTLDGKSCGYFSAGAVIRMIEMLNEGQPIERASILNQTGLDGLANNLYHCPVQAKDITVTRSHSTMSNQMPHGEPEAVSPVKADRRPVEQQTARAVEAQSRGSAPCRESRESHDPNDYSPLGSSFQ